jgi:hypothetical protein
MYSHLVYELPPYAVCIATPAIVREQLVSIKEWLLITRERLVSTLATTVKSVIDQCLMFRLGCKRTLKAHKKFKDDFFKIESPASHVP